MKPEYDYLTNQMYRIVITNQQSGKSVQYDMNYQALIDTSLKEIVDWWRFNYK